MKSRLVILASACAMATAGACLAQPTFETNYTAPRNAFGQPSFDGVWTNATVTPFERPASYGDRLVLTEEEVAAREQEEQEYRAEGNEPTDPSLTIEDLPVNCGRGFSGTNCGYNRGWTDPGVAVMRVGGEPRTSFITYPENGRVPPRKDDAPATAGFGLPRGVGRLDNPETQSSGVRCLTSFGSSAGPVMLPLLYNNTYKFVQGADAVAIWVEMVHDVRIIRLNSEHSGVEKWFGDSIGWYEGDTLVVETTDYHPSTRIRGASEDLTVIEKFTRVANDRLLYQFEVRDPNVWAEPWGGEYEFFTSPGDIYEYACHEGNYALEGMLAGARAEEAEAAAEGEPVAAR